MSVIMESKIYSSIEICPQIKNSLMLLQQTNIITNELLNEILELAIKNILTSHKLTSVSNITSSKSDLVKELYAALTDLIIQNARYDLTEENLEEYCSETLKLNTNYGQIISKFCSESKLAVQKKLSTVTILSEPMLKGLNWKLDCIVKTSEAGSVDTDAIYRIRLVALKYNPETNSNEPTYISFSCDVLELTDLVSKLKDICRHVEKLSENIQKDV